MTATVILLAGCNLAPTYQAPEPGINSDYTAAQPGTGLRATETSESEFFADPLLQGYIATALQQNRDLGAATARIAQAHAQFRVQQSQRLPGVQGTGSGQRTSAKVPATEPAQRVIAESYSVQVAVPAFELDFWGRIANLSESARRQYLATVEAEQVFRLSLIANVAATYYAIRASEEGIVLAEKSLTSRGSTLELAKLRMDAGLTSSIDYNQAYALVTQAETQLAQLYRSRDFAMHQLQVLTGTQLPPQLPAGVPIADASQLAPLDPGLPSDLLTNRPDIRMFEQRLRAANANIGAARALYLPTIALTGAGGYASTELSGLFTDKNRIWSFGVGAVLPIFDWGQRKAQVRLAKANYDELEMQYQAAVQNAFREVADGLSAAQRNGEQIEAQERTVHIQNDLAATAQDRYSVGLTPFLEVLDAERGLFSAEQALLQLRATALQDRVNLYVALGGG